MYTLTSLIFLCAISTVWNSNDDEEKRTEIKMGTEQTTTTTRSRYGKFVASTFGAGKMAKYNNSTEQKQKHEEEVDEQQHFKNKFLPYINSDISMCATNEGRKEMCSASVFSMYPKRQHRYVLAST